VPDFSANRERKCNNPHRQVGLVGGNGREDIARHLNGVLEPAALAAPFCEKASLSTSLPVREV
jgi:hypothetical protein